MGHLHDFTFVSEEESEIEMLFSGAVSSNSRWLYKQMNYESLSSDSRGKFMEYKNVLMDTSANSQSGDCRV